MTTLSRIGKVLDNLIEMKAIGKDFQMTYSERTKFVKILICNNSSTMDARKVADVLDEEFGENLEALYFDENHTKVEVSILL